MKRHGAITGKLILVAIMILMSNLAFGEWFFRGTANNWGSTQMTFVSGTIWETTQDFTGNTNPRFKIDRYGDWKTAYPSADYVVAAKKYKITFNSSTKAITVSEVGGTDNWYFRGTPNNWGTTAMTLVAGSNTSGSITKYETTQDFTGNTNPRFKIDHKGDWTEAYPATDYLVAAKKYRIEFTPSTNQIAVSEVIDNKTVTGVVITGPSEVNTGATIQLTATVSYSDGTTSTTAPVTWAATANGVATIDTTGKVTGVTAGQAGFSATISGKTASKTITVKTPADNWYFRGTANNWAATAMTQVAGTTKWEIIVDFTGNTNPRFKIDHKGDWTEAYPATDYLVSPKKYKVTFDSATKAITLEEIYVEKVVASVAVSGAASVNKGESTQLTAAVTYTDGTTSTTVAASWSSSNTGVAAVDSTGKVTGAAKGDATITATVSGKSGTKAISVTENVVTNINGTMIQYFEWYLPNDGQFWNKVKADAGYLANMGITALWLPPAYKGGSSADVGYGVYDIYDLGEFNQKGTVRTKYGTKAEYIAAIDEIHAKGMQVYADVVLNHRLGSDGTEVVSAKQVEAGNRNNAKTGYYDIEAWTVFNFPGRGNTYSSYKWDKNSFNGSDYDNRGKVNQIFLFNGKNWDWEVDTENGNYDYLMGADVDFDNPNVVTELKNWGKWYVDTAKLDGFRIDAVKHIKFGFFSDWLGSVRSATGKPLFAVGEYWNGDVNKLNNYITKTNGAMSLFDVALHYNFFAASNQSGGYDMRYIYNNTLTASNPMKSVTIVDNHDTQPGQMLQSPVKDWFKPLAYAMILLREEGYPCVFYGDFYGAQGIASHKTIIEKLMNARKNYAYGTQKLYFDNPDVVGWTRAGDAQHPKSMAVVLSDGAGGTKYMNTGKANVGYYDITGNVSGTVYTDGSGNGNFRCNGGSVSVWVQE